MFSGFLTQYFSYCINEMLHFSSLRVLGHMKDVHVQSLKLVACHGKGFGRAG